MACQPVCPPHARRSTCECDSCTFSSPETHAVTRHLPETTLRLCQSSPLSSVISPRSIWLRAPLPRTALPWCVLLTGVCLPQFVCVISPSQPRRSATGDRSVASDPRADRTRSRFPSRTKSKIENVPARSGVEAALARGSRACRSSELEQGGGARYENVAVRARGPAVRAAPCPSPVRREAPGPGTRSRDPDLNRPSQLPYTGYTLARYDIAIAQGCRRMRVWAALLPRVPAAAPSGSARLADRAPAGRGSLAACASPLRGSLAGALPVAAMAHGLACTTVTHLPLLTYR